MPRRLTLKLGFARQAQDVTVIIPDEEPMPWQLDEQFAVVGFDRSRLDGALKARGGAGYTYDIELPGMLYGAILRSPYPHARVGRVELAGALKIPGVRAAIARDDQIVRFAGQEIAAVAAVNRQVADDALSAIVVDYHPLPFVANMEEALKSSAPRVYASSSNASSAKLFHTGNVEDGLAHSALVHEAVYTTPVQAHVSLETHGAVAKWDGDKLTVWVSTQGIFTVRDDLMVFFSLPPENVRVITAYLGGGFGSKFGAGAEVIMAAQLARQAGAPVKLMLSRAAEHLATGNRPSSWQRVKLGATAEAKLAAIQLIQHGSGGIGGGAGSSGPFRQIYHCPNIRTEERDVYLNAGPSSPMRAPGWPQGCFALEMAIDELARRLGIDRLEFRRRNNSNAVRALEYEVGARAFDWRGRSRRTRTNGALRRGIGVASGWWHGTGRAGSQAEVVAYRDGRVELRTGSQDIGTGTRTILAMIAAEELGIPISRVFVEIGDTRYRYAVPSGGSSTAPSTTPAVRQAAAHLKEKLFRIAAPSLGADPGDLEARDAAIRVRFEPSRALSFAEVCRHIPGDSLAADGEHVPDYQGFRTDQGGCQFAEVEVDSETGIVRALEVVAVHDAGLIIDPLTARSQVNGGIIMGVGFALFEARRLDPKTGLMVNPTMDDYKLPGALDVPDIKVMFVEVANGITNTGVLGLGEAAHVATAAAIACAVFDAIGVPVRSLPLTPDRVLAALGAV